MNAKNSIKPKYFVLHHILQVCLTSRDQQNVLVVSYAELHSCLETSFSELQQAALAPAHLLEVSTNNPEQ